MNKLFVLRLLLLLQSFSLKVANYTENWLSQLSCPKGLRKSSSRIFLLCPTKKLAFNNKLNNDDVNPSGICWKKWKNMRLQKRSQFCLFNKCSPAILRSHLARVGVKNTVAATRGLGASPASFTTMSRRLAMFFIRPDDSLAEKIRICDRK